MGFSITSSICILWNAQNVENRLTPYRMLLERLLYLAYLDMANESGKFAKCSQAEQYCRIIGTSLRRDEVNPRRGEDYETSPGRTAGMVWR